jgi:hypothetical protein
LTTTPSKWERWKGWLDERHQRVQRWLSLNAREDKLVTAVWCLIFASLGAIAIGTLTWRKAPESQDALRSELRGRSDYDVEARLGRLRLLGRLLGRLLRTRMPPAPRDTLLVRGRHVLVYDWTTTDPKTGATSSEVYVWVTQERSGEFRVVTVYFSKKEMDEAFSDAKMP